MPGRDYQQAYAMLEESMRDVSWKRDDTGILTSRPGHAPTNLTAMDSASSQHIDWASSASLEDDYNGSDGDGDSNSSVMATPPAMKGLVDGLPPTPPSNHPLLDSLASSRTPRSPRNSGPSTPSIQRSPPTPDLTPPRFPGVSSGSDRIDTIASPYATTESFQTAKEYFPATHNSGESMGPRSDEGDKQTEDWLDSTRPTRLSSLGWGTEFPLTPIHSDQSRASTLQPHVINREGIEAKNISLDGDMNSTHSSTPDPQTLFSGQTDMHSPYARLATKNRLFGRHTPTRSSSDSGGSSTVTSPLANDHETWDDSLGLGLRLRSNKRPGHTNTPPVISAQIIDTPPARRQKLRHVSKAISLRDETVGNDSQRSSVSSGGTPSHRLIHKTQQISDRNKRWSGETDATTSVASHSRSLSGHSLRRRTDTIPQRPLTAPEGGVAPFDLINRPHNAENIDQGTESMKQVIADPSPRTPHHDLVDAAVSRALMEKSTNSETPVVNDLLFVPNSPLTQRSFGAHSTEFKSRDYSALQRDTSKQSLGQVSVHSDNLASPGLPFGQSSVISLTGSKTPEVIEAERLWYYSPIHPPAVVQNPLGIDRVLEEEEKYPGSIGVDVSVPSPSPLIHNEDSANIIDSPLTNPRKPPEPPVLSIIPPTPANGLDTPNESPDKTHLASNTILPTRSGSLLQRARRYSDNLIQPLKTFNTVNTPLRRRSTRKRGSSPYQNPHGGSPSSPPSVSEQQGNLHPFWQPRHFWNDFSDDDAEGEDYDDIPTPRQQPQRADTTSRWRRGGSLRGFLIGNTLGLERGPTNARRPVIWLPSMMQKKQEHEQRKLKPNGTGGANTSIIHNSEPLLPSYNNDNETTTVRASARRSGSKSKHTRSASTGRLLQNIRDKFSDARMSREEKTRISQREKLRNAIGPSYYVDSNQRA